MDAVDSDGDGIGFALRNVAVTQYIGVAGLVVLLYDHLLTLDDEVKYIWSARNTIPKIGFLLMRYLVPLFIISQTIIQSGLSTIYMSDVTCKAWISFTACGGWFSIGISNLLVVLRICTLLSISPRRAIPWFMAFFAATQLTSLALTSWTISLMIPLLVFDDDLGICIFTSRPNVLGLWVVGIAFEVIVFAILCCDTLRSPRSTHSDAMVTRVLLRDGCVYFIFLITIRIANAVIAAVAPTSLLFVATSFVWSVTTLTTSNMIINSRRVAARTMGKASVREG